MSAQFLAGGPVADAVLADVQTRAEALAGAGIVHSKVYRNAEVVEDPQLIANGLIVPTDSDEPGYDRALATPFRVHGSPQETPRRAPTIGQHSIELLLEHGFTQDQIDTLVANETVGAKS